MDTDDTSAPAPAPAPAPARRRIIQQPLRTEAAYALIAADAAQTGELEAVLKRDRPLITFPSISHFLAEPVRREPWAAVVVARAGAWDPRFDSHVRRRRAIALFGMAEEIYSWPETVARVSDLTELSAWLESLAAPEPAPPAQRTLRRVQRAQAKAELGASRLPLRAPTTPAPAEPRREVRSAAHASAAPVEKVPRPTSAAPEKRRVKAPTRQPPAQPASAGRHLASRRSTTRAGPKFQNPTPPEQHGTNVHAPEITSARSSSSAEAADREFTRLAAELGLVRAREVLEELRERAARLVRAIARDPASARSRP